MLDNAFERNIQSQFSQLCLAIFGLRIQFDLMLKMYMLCFYNTIHVNSINLYFMSNVTYIHNYKYHTVSADLQCFCLLHAVMVLQRRPGRYRRPGRQHDVLDTFLRSIVSLMLMNVTISNHLFYQYFQTTARIIWSVVIRSWQIDHVGDLHGRKW